jgi:hypothetical protein
MYLALAPAKLVSFGMAIVVELHAERLVDRRDGAFDLDATLACVDVNHLELARLRPDNDGLDLVRVGAEHRGELGFGEIVPALRRLRIECRDRRHRLAGSFRAAPQVYADLDRLLGIGLAEQLCAVQWGSVAA